MIPDDVRRFVLTSMPSVPHLEAMLLFHDEPATARRAADVARSLYVTESAAQDLLIYLCEIGCLESSPETQAAYRFKPRDPAMRALLSQLAAAYRAETIAMTNLIHNTTQKNAHRFADAFKLKKER